MLLESGWSDDLFPPEQSLRVDDQVRAMKGYVALMVGDLGHSPGTNKENTDHAFNEEGARFFEARLKHEGKAPASGGVTAYTQTCPTSAPGGGPYTARNWSTLHRHALTFGSSAAQAFTSAGGSGEERLISRGVYRLTENETGMITLQLHGNGYEFAKGDTVKLQLLGRDAPYYRASKRARSTSKPRTSACRCRHPERRPSVDGPRSL